MEKKKNKLSSVPQANPTEMLELGSWLGRHQAFGLMANRCAAADAECLKRMRDSGEYKKLGLNWEEFCGQKAGMSRRNVDRLIAHLEEFGSNYFRLSELMQISSETFRLIAGAVSEDGLEYEGEKISLTPGNRKQVMVAVEALRQRDSKKRNPRPSADAIRHRLDALLEDAKALPEPDQLVLIGLLLEGAGMLSQLSQEPEPPRAA